MDKQLVQILLDNFLSFAAWEAIVEKIPDILTISEGKLGSILFWIPPRKLGKIGSPQPRPQLSELIFLRPPGERAIFLHSNVLYNNMQFVSGGGGGGGRKKH